MQILRRDRTRVAERLSLRGVIVAFAGGAAWLQTQAELPSWQALWWLPLGVLVLGLLLSGTVLQRPGPLRRLVHTVPVVLTASVFGLAGFYYAAWRAELRLADHLDPLWVGRTLTVEGRVLGLPQSTPFGQRFVLEVVANPRQGVYAPEGLPSRLSVALPSRWATAAVRGGDCLRLALQARPPRGHSNPGVSDGEAWLFERGIRAEARAVGQPTSSAACSGFGLAQITAWRDRWREAWRADLQRSLAGQPYAGVVVALALGDQAAIDSDLWRLFRQTGVTHLMSISGLHITLLSGLVYALVLAGWRRVAFLTLRWPARKVAVIAGLMLAWAYTALAGFGIPAQRTLFMVLSVAVFVWLDRFESPSRVLVAALGVVVLIDPWAALAPGFWLSFLAVAALFFTGVGRVHRLPLLPAWLHTQTVATVALLPILLYLFHEVSLVSPLANAIAIPVISIVVVPLCLLAMLVPWDSVALWPHAVLAVQMDVLQGLAALPQPVWHVGQASGWGGIFAMWLAGAGVVWLLLPVPWRWRVLGLLLLLPMLYPRLERPPPGVARLQVLDVGQGLAAVVLTQNHALLFDAGPRFASGGDSGQRNVAPFLWSAGIRQLDMLVVSHQDTDHSGGAASVLTAFTPRRVIHGEPPAVGDEACVAGQTWDWDGVRFSVLHPPARYAKNPYFSANERSCVVRLETAHGALLLSADIGRLGELELLERSAELLPSRVMLVPHHGSKSSSAAAFIAAVKPELALISVGAYNRFGHPHPETLARYAAIGAKVWRTDQVGSITLEFGKADLAPQGWRQHARRYWRSWPGDQQGSARINTEGR